MSSALTSDDEMDSTSFTFFSDTNYDERISTPSSDIASTSPLNTIPSSDDYHDDDDDDDDDYTNNEKDDSSLTLSSSSYYIQDHTSIVKNVRRILHEVDAKSMANDAGGLWGILINHDIGPDTNNETGKISKQIFWDVIRTTSGGHEFDTDEMKIIVTSFSDFDDDDDKDDDTNELLFYKEMAAFCEVKRKPKAMMDISKRILQHISKRKSGLCHTTTTIKDYIQIFTDLDTNGEGWVSNTQFYQTMVHSNDNDMQMSHADQEELESCFSDGEMMDYISVSSYIQSCDVDRTMDLLHRAIRNDGRGGEDPYDEYLTMLFHCLEQSCQENNSDAISDRDVLAQAFDKFGILLNEVQIDSMFDILCSDSNCCDPRDFVEMIQAQNKMDHSFSSEQPHAADNEEQQIVSSTATFHDKASFRSATTKFHDKASFRGALRLAFDFMDNDNNGTINKKEFEDILWAIGFDPETQEVMELWSSSAILQSPNKNKAEVNFKQLLDITIPHLKKKMNALSKMKEAQLRTLFDTYDSDKNGCVSWNEFRSIFVEEMQTLDPSEARAIFKEIDEDRNGEISWEEFKSIFTIFISDARKDEDCDDDGDVTHDENDDLHISSKNSNIYSSLDFAIRKARYWSTMSDPISFLQAFIGLPASFRPSVIQPLDMVYEHSLQSILTPTHDYERGMGVKDLEVSFVSQEKHQRRSVILQPTTTSRDTTAVVGNKHDFESEFIQFQIELLMAKVVPKPHDARIEDVIERSFRVILFKNDSKIPTERRWIGNSYKAPALQDSIRTDKWTFPSLGGVYFDNKFLIRINRGQPIKNIHMLIELTITIRSIKEDLHQRNEEKQGQETLFDEREISCCWCAISLHDMMEFTTTTVINPPLNGGSPFSSLNINTDKNDYTSTSNVNSLQKSFFSMGRNQTKSELDIFITPFRKISKVKREHINYLPRTIICPMNWISLIHIYSELVAEAFYYSSTNGPTRTLAPGHYGAMSEPVLSMFPKINTDVALTRLFCWLWQENCSKYAKGEGKFGTATSTSRMNRDVIRQLLYETVQIVWFASSAITAKCQSIDPSRETYSETEKRFQLLKTIVSDDRVNSYNSSHNEILFAPFDTSEVAFFLHY